MKARKQQADRGKANSQQYHTNNNIMQTSHLFKFTLHLQFRDRMDPSNRRSPQSVVCAVSSLKEVLKSSQSSASAYLAVVRAGP